MVGGDAGEGCGVGIAEVDVLDEEFVPVYCCGAEDDWWGLERVVLVLGEGMKERTTAIAGHACCAEGIVFVEAALLDGLLGEDIASCEEDLWFYQLLS